MTLKSYSKQFLVNLWKEERHGTAKFLDYNKNVCTVVIILDYLSVAFIFTVLCSQPHYLTSGQSYPSHRHLMPFHCHLSTTHLCLPSSLARSPLPQDRRNPQPEPVSPAAEVPASRPVGYIFDTPSHHALLGRAPRPKAEHHQAPSGKREERKDTGCGPASCFASRAGPGGR